MFRYVLCRLAHKLFRHRPRRRRRRRGDVVTVQSNSNNTQPIQAQQPAYSSGTTITNQSPRYVELDDEDEEENIGLSKI